MASILVLDLSCQSILKWLLEGEREKETWGQINVWIVNGAICLFPLGDNSSAYLVLIQACVVKGGAIQTDQGFVR